MSAVMIKKCSICAAEFDSPIIISGMRRSNCRICGHSQRLDFENFDYKTLTMGASGVDEKRLESQSRFIAPYLKADARVLEIGCATGELARAIRRRYEIARYDGVELSPSRDAAALHLDNVFDRPLDQLTTYCIANDLQYSLVIASHVLEHMDDPSAFLQAITPILMKTGKAFIEVPNRSGHPLLPYDDNRSHLHFFSVSSLSRLLMNHGFEIVAIESGARFDARYPDSIRMIATYAPKAARAEYLLSQHPLLAGTGKLVVWGAGKMTDEILAHFFDPARIDCFIDRDPAKQGGYRLGAPILSPETLKSKPGAVVLINSLEMEPAIRAQIEAEYSDSRLRVIGISSLLELPTN